MTKGIIRLIKEKGILEESGSLHDEGDKESVEVVGKLLPNKECGIHSWCAEVSLINDEMDTRIDHVVAVREVAMLVLYDQSGTTSYGEIGHMEPVHNMVPGDRNESRAKWEKSFKCLGVGILVVQSGDFAIEKIDNALDEAADRRDGKR